MGDENIPNHLNALLDIGGGQERSIRKSVAVCSSKWQISINDGSMADPKNNNSLIFIDDLVHCSIGGESKPVYLSRGV